MWNIKKVNLYDAHLKASLELADGYWELMHGPLVKFRQNVVGKKGLLSVV